MAVNRTANIMNQPEIIDFHEPLESEKNLYVTNITVYLPEDEAAGFIQSEFHKAFSKFGLLYGILPVIPNKSNSTSFLPVNANNTTILTAAVTEENSSNNKEPCRLYAFVKFYSKLSALRAKMHLHMKNIVGTTPCKIQYSQRKMSANRQKQPLYPSKCFDLAKHYLGFDGWSTSIKMLKRDDPVNEDKNGGGDDDDKSAHQISPNQSKSMCRFVSVVQLDIHRHGVTTNGIGTAQERVDSDMTNKGGVMARCRKKAYRESIRNAFSRILMVVLASGKVFVDVDSSIPDTIAATDYLKDPHLLTMNELLKEPKEESSDEEQGGADEKDSMDNEMIQILAALQDGNE